MKPVETREFIIDFIYSINNSDDFEISIKEVAKWLKVQEKALKQTVNRSYKEGVDYIKDRQYTNGRPRDNIYLTNTCFKSLCLRSNSKRGEMVRKYFIVIENAYREYMTQTIHNRQRIDDEEYNYKFSVIPRRNIQKVMRFTF